MDQTVNPSLLVSYKSQLRFCYYTACDQFYILLSSTGMLELLKSSVLNPVNLKHMKGQHEQTKSNKAKKIQSH